MSNIYLVIRLANFIIINLTLRGGNMLIIDRIEENVAVCEDENSMRNIPIDLIEAGAKEGDVIINKNGLYFIDIELTKKRKNEIEAMMKGMWE